MKRISLLYTDLFKKVFLFSFMVFASLAVARGQNFTINGSASNNGTDCFILTPNQNGQNGSAWYNKKIDLKYNFDINYSVYLGNNPSGADGMAFVLQSASSTLQGTSGSGMGYGGISPSLDLEYDTYPNTDFQAYDPGYDHMCLMKNGDFHHNSGALISPVALNNLSNGSVKDGQYHACRTTWDAGSSTLTAYFDGIQKFSYTGDIINNIFSGSSGVYFGFTASTGGASNQHAACVNLAASAFQIFIPFDIQITSTNITCGGNGADGSAVVTFTGGTAPYTFDGWTYPDGTINFSTSISNLSAGTYSAKAHDGSGNVISKSIAVTFSDHTPPVINNMPGNISINNDPGKCGANVAFFPPPPGPVVDQQITDGYTGTLGGDQWQSFTAGKTGLLTQIDLLHNGCQQTDFTFTIYSGVGTGGTVLYSGPYNFGYFCSQWFGIAIPAKSQPNVIAGQTYTFRLQGNGTGFVAGSGSNPGTYYSSSYGTPPWKLDFKSYVQAASVVPTATDNCGTPTLTSDHASGDFFPAGNTLVTYTATDAAGNVATSSFSVVVTDNEKPTVITKPATIYLVNGSASLTAGMIDNGSTDNCGISSMTVSKNLFDCTNKGNNVVTLTVTDVNGNTSSANANVTVIDASTPTPTLATLPVITGACSATVNIAPTAVDGCGNNITGTTTDPLVYNQQGTFTINWKFTSPNGNVSLQTQQVFIHDDVPPVAPVLSDLSGQCQVIAVAPVAVDNCSGNVTGTTTDPLVYNIQGSYVIHWTFTDAAGNSSSAIQNVNVADTIKPSFITPASSGSANVTIPYLQTPVSSWASTSFNFADPLPSGAIITGIDLAYSGADQGWGGTDGANYLYVSGTYLGGNIFTHSAQNFTLHFAGPIPGYVYGGSNLFQFSFQGWPGWQGFIYGGTMTIHYQVPASDSSPKDILINNDPNQCSAAVTLSNPNVTDNCGISSIKNDAPSVFPVGTTIVTWTVTDINNNINTATQKIIVKDNTAPVAPVIADVTGECSATVTTSPTAVDNCAGTVTGTTTDPLSYSTQGTHVIHWTFSDGNGNISNATQNVIVKDITNPVINSVPDITVYATSSSGASVNYTAPTASDNCTLISNTLTGGLSSGSTFPIGTTPVTYTAVDEAGLKSSTTFNIIVLGVSPKINSLSDINTQNTPGKCGSYVTFTAIDNTGIPVSTISYSIAPGTLFPIGTTAVTATATNAVGSSTISFNVTVTDSEIPTFLNPLSPITLNTDLGKCGVAINLPTPGVADNCGIASIKSDAPTVFSTGTTTVKWTVTDVNNNINVAFQTVTIIDNEKPTITAPSDVIVSTDPGTNIASNVNIGTPATSDNCGTASVSNDAPSSFPFGTTKVNWKVTDVNGNSSFAVQLVKVIDTEAPKAIVSSSIIKTNDPGICGAVVNYPAVFVLDNVSTTGMTISAGDADGVITFNTPVLNNVNGINFVSSGDYNDIAHGHGKNISVLVELFNPLTNAWVAVQTIQTGQGDFHFGGTSYNFPVIPRVSQIRFTASAFVGAAFHLYQLKVNLNSIRLIQTTGLPSGSVSPVGTTVNTFQSTDESGNITTSTFTVTVADGEKPVIGGYQSSTHLLTSDCSWAGTAGNITVTDNCPSDLMMTENDVDANGNIIYSGQYSIHQGSMTLPVRNFPTGTNTVQLSVTDASGNVSASAQFTVTVNDRINPTIVASGNITRNANPGVCRAFVRVPLPVVSDNCAVQSFINSYNGTPNATDNYPVGTTVITWTVTDGSGNTSTATQSITVVDVEAPVIMNLPQNIIQTSDAGICGAIVTWPQPISTDNCGLSAFTSDHQSGEVFPIGVTIVNFKATDIHNNISNASFTITVTDNEAPIVSVKPITVTLVNGSARISASDLDNGSTDNCGPVSFSASKTLFSCSDIGVNQVTLTVTDKYGNASATIAPVTVIGEIPSSTIKIIPGNAIFTGGVASNLYLGYGPQNVTLKDSVIGSSAVTYAWSGSGSLSCTTCQAPTLTPTSANLYNIRVTATNTYGCSSISTTSICVRDIRVPGVAGNVFVCHTDISTGVLQTLSLSNNAVATDLNTYPQDALGSCGMLPCGGVGGLSIASGDTQHIATITPEIKKEKLIAEPLTVKAYPNPTQDFFHLKIISNSTQLVTVKVVDENGRIIEIINEVQPNNTIQLGSNLIAGIYFAQVVQGDQVVMIKLLKMR